jgi:hypothetical protein
VWWSLEKRGETLLCRREQAENRQRPGVVVRESLSGVNKSGYGPGRAACGVALVIH